MKPGAHVAAPVVPPECNLIKVAVGVLDREPVPDADHGPLECRVEALCRVDVSRSGGVRTNPHELVGAVADPQMCRKLASDPTIGGQRWSVERTALRSTTS